MIRLVTRGGLIKGLDFIEAVHVTVGGVIVGRRLMLHLCLLIDDHLFAASRIT